MIAARGALDCDHETSRKPRSLDHMPASLTNAAGRSRAEFSHHHLDRLSVHVNANALENLNTEKSFTVLIRGLLEVDGIKLSRVGTETKELYWRQNDEDRLPLNNTRRKALEYSDSDYKLRGRKRYPELRCIKQDAGLSAYYSEVPLPDIEMSVTAAAIPFARKRCSVSTHTFGTVGVARTASGMPKKASGTATSQGRVSLH